MIDYFVDVHAHISDEKLLSQAGEVVLRAKKAGVQKIVTMGDDMQSSFRCVMLCEKFPEIYAGIGIHPENADEISDENIEALERLAKNKKVVCIGEIGLDYHYENFDKEKQKECFLKQILLANRLSLPIEVHMRDATQDVEQMLLANKENIRCGGLLHCFNASLESAKVLMDLGFCFSVGGILTFKNARNLKEVIPYLPKERIMLETDCPYLAPEPFRGSVNEPKNIPLIASFLADIWDEPIKRVAEITTKNAFALFERLGK
ncbi:MAG: TatD family hydrolase [Clostridia bacterium]